jgi:hypothetical protein
MITNNILVHTFNQIRRTREEKIMCFMQSKLFPFGKGIRAKRGENGDLKLYESEREMKFKRKKKKI